MPDQTPEVCAACGHAIGAPAETHYFDDAEGFCSVKGCECRATEEQARRAEPTPAERPEGWQRNVEYDGTRTVTRRSVRWVSGDDEWVIPVDLERAISSAAVAEYVRKSPESTALEASERIAVIEDSRRALVDRIDEAIAKWKAAERALEEAREAIREWFAAEGAHPASASLEDGSAWWSRRAHARARLRALVSTESREEGGKR